MADEVTALAIETERLKLVPLSRRQLQSYLDDPAALEVELGLPMSRGVLTERARGAIAKKVARMEEVEPKMHPWHTY